MEEKKDFYITFLKDILHKPKTWEEIEKKYPNEKDVIWSENRSSNLLVQGKDNKYRLSFESRFKLLEYNELKFAVQASKEARNIALFAIMIAVITPSIIYILDLMEIERLTKMGSATFLIIIMIWFGFIHGIIVMEK